MFSLIDPDPISLALIRRGQLHGPLMLMYHSVQRGRAIPDWPWAVSMARFRSQLDFLAGEGWKTVTMADLAARPQAWPERTVVITFDDGYRDNYEAFEALAQRGMCASWFVVAGWLGRGAGWGDAGQPSDPLLEPAQLRAMQSAGMEIGSHTVDHLRLPDLDNTQLNAQLLTSKALLEDVLGTEVVSFAYPYGAWDERCEQAVMAAGYRYACTTRSGWALRDGNPLRLRRLAIFNDDNLSSFARKIAFATNDVRWASMIGYWRRQLLARMGWNT
ncbi:MAG: polysaccharide deacetylase family protein [Burkholderiales bacterium]|nr:polysaccharide deacetylase family protein [Burkholderiales bacterium]